jgi:tetratricopeptide (TPR) repeat protein
MNELPLIGNIPDTSLPAILTHLNRSRKSGTLIIKTPVFTKKVFLVKGDAVFASSTFEDDRLGEMLLKAGKITMEQYDRSVDLLKRTGKRQGAILVELGYISPKDLFWGVKYQVKEIIYTLFLIEKAQYEFIEGEIPSQEVITLKMSMGNLVYEGVKRVDNWTRIRNEMPATDTVLRLSSDPATIYQDVELSQQDRRMLSMVDGKKSVKELIDSAWIGSFEAMKTLYVLWSIGVLEEKKREPEAEKTLDSLENIDLGDILNPVSEDEQTFIRKVDEMYMRLDYQSPHDLLGVDEDADEETLKRHFYRLTREFHPDRHFGAADPSLKDKLDAVFNAINQAYASMAESLGKRSKSGLFRPAAERKTSHAYFPERGQIFKQGIDEFKKGNFQRAADLFSSNVDSEPGNAKYWSYLSLALTKLQGRAADAAKAMLEAAKLEPDCADHYANLGLIYSREGIIKKAREAFDKALKIDPGNPKARKGLEKIRG